MEQQEIYDKFDELQDNVKCILADMKNQNMQHLFINNIADVIEYTIKINNHVFSKQILEFLVDTFITIGELDYDSVENVLDALTASRIIINNLINKI